MRDCTDVYHDTTAGGYCSRCGRQWKHRHLCDARKHTGPFAPECMLHRNHNGNHDWSTEGLNEEDLP